MVHSKPEYAESVKLLTYSQLRRLEKMDARKEREAKLLEIARTGVEAGGRAAQGLFSNQIIGTVIGAGIALQFPEFWENAGSALIRLGADLANAIREGVSLIPPPTITPEGHDENNQANFCLRYQFSITQQPITACYPTAQARDDAVSKLLSEHVGKVWKI